MSFADSFHLPSMQQIVSSVHILSNFIMIVCPNFFRVIKDRAFRNFHNENSEKFL